MLEIKFDSANEMVMVEYLKSLFKDNPILLQNIVEPKVNSIIEGGNVSAMIHEKLKELYDIGEIKQVISDTIGTFDLDRKIEESVKEYVSQSLSDYTIKQKLDDVVKEVVEEEIDSNDSFVQTRTDNILARMIKERIDSINIASIVQKEVRVAVQSHKDEIAKSIPGVVSYVQNSSPVPSDIIVLHSSPEITTALTWLLQMFVKENKLKIVSVNGN